MSVEISKPSGSFTAHTYVSLLGLGITIPLVVLLGALLLQSASAQRAEIESHLVQAVDALVKDLDRDLDRDITILHTLATSPAVAAGDWRTFYQEASAGLQGRAYIVLTDTVGRQLVNTYVPYGKQPAMTGDPETIRRIVQAKAPVVSNLFTSLVVKKPVFNVSIPVWQDGEVRYVMSLGLLSDDLVELLQAQTLSPNWLTVIWDANGVILARSRENERYLGTSIPQHLRERGRPNVVRTATLDGTDVLHAAAHSHLSGWGAGVNLPYSVVTAEARSALLLWGVAAVLAVTIALVFGMFFARQITSSLSAAATAAARFGRGEPFPLTGSRLREADAFLATLEKARQERAILTEELKQSRDWLETTLASIGDGVIATDDGGRITFLNGVSQSLTGWLQQEAIGRPLEEIFVLTDEETGAPAENPVSKAIREGRIVGLANHTTLTAKDGRQTPIDDSAAPIRDAGGNLIGVVLVFRDITERKKAEDLLNRSVTELRRVNEDLSHFAFAASHDLQEPLRMITSYSQLLLRGYRGQLDAQAETCVDYITDGTRRMRELLASLLAYTQLSGGRLDSGPVDLNEVFRIAAENCRPAADEAGVTITCGPLPMVQGYGPHLTEVFQNLIGNSLKYKSARPLRIEVSAEKKDGVWRIAVQDNGIGIAPEYHKQIFGVFKRLHGREISGTGIGLSICQRIVNRHGGEIWVESVENQGAIFFFTLPATTTETSAKGASVALGGKSEVRT